MDVLLLSRLQFAATTLFHFLFVPLTLGLSILVAIMETQYVRTGNETYLRMTKFWGKLFLINFAVGVVTGITLEFQFGTNWSRYSALMLILFTLILRGVSFEFRGKVESPQWRKFWDICVFVGSIAPAILFGVAFANIFQGIAFDGDGVYHGTLLTLLNPYGLLGGVLFLVLFLVHGALWLAIRSEGELQQRALAAAAKLWPVELGVAVIFLVASMFATRLYDNYLANPVLFIVILLAVAGLLGIKVFLTQKALFKAWFASALTIVAATFYGVIGLFPNLFPSNIDPSFSLTAHNAASSDLTLKIMLVVVILFVPIVLVYQAWAYNLFKGKVKPEDMVY